ncbi:superoxide dismutase [Paraphoma chrysanthemicola]|nr:superoxide dismutase [Paraphoma chrysanthemicola]
MLRLCLLTSLLGLASAQGSSVVNNWYSAPAISSTSVATSSLLSRTSSIRSPTPLAPSAPFSALPNVATPRTFSTLLSKASSSAASSSTVRSSTASSSTSTAIRAVATIVPFGNSNVKGTVTFQQADTNSATIITYDLTGNTPNMQRGIHIHEVGNTNCTLAMGHFDPFKMGHGLLTDPVRHAGDLGNIAIDSSGNAKGSLSARLVTLSGPNRVIGLTFVMHGGEDDGGKTGMGNSSTTGNSGSRVGCGIINLSA